MTLPSQSAGHSPGPWSVDPDPRPGMSWNRHIYSADGMAVCFMAHSAGKNVPGDIANAQLIARAPALLAENSKLKGQLEEAVKTLEMIRDQTYVDAEGPELRAQNECNHRRAIEVLSKLKEAGS